MKNAFMCHIEEKLKSQNKMAAFYSPFVDKSLSISNLSPTNVNICLNLCPVWRGQNFSVLRKRKRLDGGDGGSES